MIVEDEEVIRQELSLLLHNAGYETEEITEFSMVAEQIVGGEPDLVLLDVSLPTESGLKICSKVREFSQVPVIFVTANNTSMDELNCILQGGDDYVAKPYQALTYLFRHQGKLVSRVELMDYLWDNQVFIDDNTLSVNMTRIRNRLAELGVQDFILTRRGMGYLIP